jgi:phage FluMu protein Com
VKTTISRILSVRFVAVCGAAFLAVLLVGCQTSGKLVSVTQDTKCPLCHTETRTTAVKGLDYTKHICPNCKTVWDTGTSDEAAALTKVHVCDHCKAIVGLCPKCASK